MRSPRTKAGAIKAGGEFARRRCALMRMLGKGALAVIPAAPTASRTRDVDHPYRQHSDFAYLTGFCEPDAIAVFAPGSPERRGGEYILFCRPRDAQREIWDGAFAGCRGAVRDFGADRAFPIGDFDRVFPELAAKCARIYLPMDGEETPHRHLLRLLRHPLRQSGGRRELLALEEPVHEMRLRKSRGETALMRRAAVISATAHRRAMRACRPGVFEYQLAAEIHYEFERADAVPAYPSIVAGGVNACTLHYTRNGDALRDGDLLLIDAGAECQLYASDITRTFPVGGRFRPVQRELYEVVLEAQSAAIGEVRPGNTWEDVHGAAVRTLTRGLVALGLLRGQVRRLIAAREYQRFYMHRTGHWLGMEVHDVGCYSDGVHPRRFEPGMVLTVEPGLYIRTGADVPRRWRNTGIRIEDDLVVTKDGARVLSDGVPKDPDEIEALVSAGG